MSLLNTDQKREKEHLAQMLTLARDYARARGFKGTFLIEPKPMEPSKHQYDVDTETVIGFLKAHGLDKDFKVNIEVNHATLAGHTFEHELAVAVDNGMLGSIDANRGDYQNGWDTDQFPIDNYELTQAMMQIIRNVVWATVVLTLMPRPVVTPPILKISSSLILPVWMQWHVLWRALQNCSKNLLTRKCLQTVMLLLTTVRVRNLKMAS